MLSIHRIKAEALASELRDPSFIGLLESGYRPIVTVPCERPDGAFEVLIAMAPPQSPAPDLSSIRSYLVFCAVLQAVCAVLLAALVLR